MKDHVKQHQDLFRTWIAADELLQPSMDILQPIIPLYNAEFPGQAIGTSTCKQCILDMLIWALNQIKENESKKVKRPD